MIVKLVTEYVKIGEDVSMEGELFYHLKCNDSEGREYELFEQPTNDNQPLMFCDGCHGELGYDHSIKPA